MRPKITHDEESGTTTITMEFDLTDLPGMVMQEDNPLPTAPQELSDHTKNQLDEVTVVVLGDHQDLSYLHLLRPSRRAWFERVYKINEVEPARYSVFEIWESEAFPPATYYLRTKVQIGKEEEVLGLILDLDGEVGWQGQISGWLPGQPIPDGFYQVTANHQEASVIDRIVKGKTLGGRGISVKEMLESDFITFERVWVAGASEADILRDLLLTAGQEMERNNWGEGEEDVDPERMKQIYEDLTKTLAL
jgi:hypothetical protein